MRTLTRVTNQTYPAIEIVVVDNASTDGTYDAIVAQFKTVKCIKVEPENIGLFKAKNLAYRNTTGKYLFSIDDDSFPGKDVITRFVDRFENNPEVGLITFNVYNERSFIQHFEDEKHLPVIQYAHEHYFWSGCGGAYRRSIVETYGAWEEWGRVVPYELGIAAKTMKMGLIGMNYSDIYVFHSFGSYAEDEGKISKWGYPTGESVNYRVADETATYSAARNSLLFVLKYYPTSLRTLFWLIKYTWYVANDMIHRRRTTLIQALLAGMVKTRQMSRERIPINQTQADRLPISFNFKGK